MLACALSACIIDLKPIKNDSFCILNFFGLNWDLKKKSDALFYIFYILITFCAAIEIVFHFCVFFWTNNTYKLLGETPRTQTAIIDFQFLKIDCF